jgi:endonuclease IV
VVPKIYLENPHVLPKNSHYDRAQQLNALYTDIKETLDASGKFFGICIDTAHLWACGQDVSSYELARAWLDELTVPYHALLFHLNDSNKNLGGGVDNHAPLLNGQMWSQYKNSPRLSGAWAFIEYARTHGVPTILERTSKTDIESELENDYSLLAHQLN